MRASANARRNPILVTGSHRSGSTWVGRMLASSRTVRYLHEPFNPKAFTPEVCGVRFEREFTHVCRENAEPYRTGLEACLRPRLLAPWDSTATGSSPAAVVHRLRRLGRGALERLLDTRLLMKDPHAVFAADWLAESFDMDVVVLIRHPAAFAGSIKKAGWWFDFQQLLDQPLLMKRHLAGFRSEIERMTSHPGDLVDQAILLWNVIYHVVAGYRDSHPDWIFARHEDLSVDAVSAFGELFRRLGLEYTARARRTVADFSSASNPRERHAESEIRRDSRSNIRNWEERLTVEEIERVRDRTREVAAVFYGEKDWP